MTDTAVIDASEATRKPRKPTATGGLVRNKPAAKAPKEPKTPKAPKVVGERKPTGGFRERGSLETKVKEQIDGYLEGKVTIKEGQALTPHVVANLIKAAHNMDAAPSAGAISDIFTRWEAYKFAKLHRMPLAFYGYTAEGMKHGLAEMKSRKSAADAAARKAAKAAG